MNYLSKSAFAAGLLTCAVTALAAHPNRHDHPWNFGFQGAIGTASVNNKLSYQESVTPDDFYSDYEQELSHITYEKPIGSYGTHLGYEWHQGKNSTWEIQLAANLFSSRDVTGAHFVDQAMSPSVTVIEHSKLKNQFNLVVDWKHHFLKDAYFSLGAGLSRLEMEDQLTVQPNDPDLAANGGPFKQTIHPMGILVTVSMGYHVSSRASIDMSMGYTAYRSVSLNDTPQLDLRRGDIGPEYVRERSTKAHLFTLTAGYSYHF